MHVKDAFLRSYLKALFVAFLFGAVIGMLIMTEGVR